MTKLIRKITLNGAQMAVFIAVRLLKVTKIYLEWGRGTGKSFMLAWFMKKMVSQMPGASFALVGSTYQQILSRTLPSTKEGLAALGLYQDYDYVVGKNGKKFGFKEPIQAPDKWDNVIHFSNGSIFQLVSLENQNSGRGLNVYGIIGDEAALFDPEKLYYNVKTTNRAKSKQFKNAYLLGAEIYASSTPLTKKGRWFTEMEDKIRKRLIKNWAKYAFFKASALQNFVNLRKEWFDEMRDQAPSELIYRAEILNERPKEIMNGFYPGFSKQNLYTHLDADYLVELIKMDYTSKDLDCRKDKDLDHSKPLIISIDWGIFLSAVASQKHPTEYRVLNNFWVEQPNTIEDLVNNVCDYYSSFKKRHIHLYYGHDGNETMDGTEHTYGQEVVNLFKERGFKVTDKSKGKPVAPHNAKYLLINNMLIGNRGYLPIKVNESNCHDLILSIERAEAMDGPKGIKKVKKDEKNPALKQQHTTHLSDAFDIPIYALYKSHLKRGRAAGFYE